MTRQKQVDITTDILAQIERVTGTTVSADDIVVFEAAAASTRPISKMGSVYNGARMSRQMLEDMAAALNSGTESVPLHTLHMQGDEIPKGRVFQGSVVGEIDGSATLRAMFYLPLAEKDLIEKINLGILDEVSVGTKSKQALCSKCGFDYFGADADFSNLFAQTCANDHIIGVDGTHLKLVGLDKWMELSLVSRGASDKPKILSRTKQLLSKEDHDRIAADGKPVEALFLFTSMTTETNDMTTKPTEFDAAAAIEALQAKLDVIEAKLTDPNEAVEGLQAELAAAQQKIADLEATAAEAAAAATAELEAAEAAEAAAATQVTLELPVGGVAASAVEDAHSLKATQGGRAGAFKTKR